MSPGNQGVFQILKEVTFRGNLAFYDIRKWGYLIVPCHSSTVSVLGVVRARLSATDWLVGPDHWKYSLDEKVVNMIYIFAKIYAL